MLYKGYIETKGKAAVEKFKNKTRFKTYEQVKDLPGFGGVLENDTILIDIDDYEQSEIMMDIVEDYQLDCRVYQTTRGKHFLFKNHQVTRNHTHVPLAIGLTADIKCGTRTSYEVIKINGEERFIEWDIEEGGTYQELPKWMLPVKAATDFIDMDAGDGRNQALFNYILTLTANGFTVDETREAIRILNKYVLKESLSDEELEVILAVNVSEIQYEAKKVIEVLNGRKLDYPVFLDIEDKCQENLSKHLMMRMINAFREIIIKAGYQFGIYCGYSWYQYQLPEDAKKYDCWLAAYPSQDDGTMQIRLKPAAGIGWQYSSKATIPGISGKVDRNVFYKDYTVTKNEDKGETTMDKAIEKVILIAKNEEGYLEKKSNSQLDSKTANAGSANFTKYWRDIEPSYQGQPWCAAFVSWCFMKAFGLEKAKKLLKHWPYVYCPTLGNLFTRNANPKIGDIVIFYHNGTFTHTGLVTAVIGDRFYTIEGNTSGASGIIANGGGVCAKSYLNSQMPGTKFCTPDYSIVSDASAPAKPENTSSNTTQTGEEYMFEPKTVKAGDKNTSVLLLQEILKSRGFKGKNKKDLDLDWEAGDNTIYALKQYQKSRGLDVDGVCGSATWKDLIAI